MIPQKAARENLFIRRDRDTSMQERATLMTEGSVWRHIVGFALPVFWGNLFQQLYNVVDSLVVGNFLGSDALAAVGSSSHLIFLMVGLFSGIFTGASVVISRYYGAQDDAGVQMAVHTTVAFGLVAGVITTIAGVMLTPRLLIWMGTPESVLPNSILYFRIYFYGVIFVILYNTAAGIFQAVGDSRHPLYYLIVSSVVNVVLDLLFVAGFGMGVDGAALATVISQAASAVLGFWRLGHVTGSYRVWVKKVRFHARALRQLLTLGIPSGIQNSSSPSPTWSSSPPSTSTAPWPWPAAAPIPRSRGSASCPSTASRWPWPPLSARIWAPGNMTAPGAARALASCAA